MAKKGSSAGQKSRYAAYKAKDSVTKNAARALARHLKKHPNDEQALGAQAKGVGRTRKTPTARCGWVTDGVRAAMGHTAVTRRASREMARVLALSSRIAKQQLTKAEQKARNKVRK